MGFPKGGEHRFSDILNTGGGKTAAV